MPHPALKIRAAVAPQQQEQWPQAVGVRQQGEQQLAETPLPGASEFRSVQLGPGCFEQFVVAHTRWTGADAGEAAQAGVEMGCDLSIEREFSIANGFERMDPSPWGIHLCAKDAVTRAGW